MALFAAGSGLGPGYGEGAQLAAREAAPAHDAIELAVVQLLAIGPGGADKNSACSSTGFFVNEQGYLLTNAHVMEEARRCLAASPSGKIVAKLARPGARTAQAYSCDVVAVDELRDLAVLKTERPLPADASPFYAFLDGDEPPAGARISVTGHPAFAWHAVTDRGRLVGRARLALDDKSAEKSDVLILDVSLRKGSSGSPVVLESGAVVGVVERRNPARPSQTVAVPIRYAIELLERHGVRWYASRGQRALDQE